MILASFKTHLAIVLRKCEDDAARVYCSICPCTVKDQRKSATCFRFCGYHPVLAWSYKNALSLDQIFHPQAQQYHEIHTFLVKSLLFFSLYLFQDPNS